MTLQPNFHATRGPTHHGDFIHRFTRRESQKKKRPTPLSAAQRARLREQLKEVKFLKPSYADHTKINIAGMLRKWKKYCEFNKFEESWKTVIENANREVAMDFLHHMCDTCKIKSEGSSWEYFRQFKQLYSSVTGRYMDTNDSKEIQKWHDGTLVFLFGLEPPNANGKPVIGIEGQLAMLTYNIAYDTSIRPQERQRVDMHGIYLLLGYTGARPAELVDGEKKPPKDGSLEEIFGPKVVDDDSDDEGALDENSRLLEVMLSQATRKRGRPKALCYEDIMLAVVRHPETGRDVHVMAVKLVHHKGEDRKPRPTIYFFFATNTLIMCPITAIVGLANRDKAFDAPSLTSARRVFAVRNVPPAQCTPLRWKEEMLKVPVFRRVDNVNKAGDPSIKVEKMEAFPYSVLRDASKQQSLDAGFEQALGPRAWRRWTANEANGKASDAVRDQIMRHDPRWTTFYGAYLNQAVEFDIENTMLGLETQDRLIKMLTHISLTRDPRAKRDMVPDEVWRDMPPAPEILELERRRAELKNGRFRIKGCDDEDEIRRIGEQIRQMRSKRDKDIQDEYRKFYFRNRPTWDIENQARGETGEEYVTPAIDLRIPERAQLAEILCGQSKDLSDEEIVELRIRAADLMAALCGKRETAKSARIRQRPRADVQVKQESSEPELEPDPFPLIIGNKQCPDCIGDERLTFEERTFSYCRPTVRNDHFDGEHLKGREAAEQCGQLQLCMHPKCRELEFQDLNHFRNHVAKVHGVPLRTQEEVERIRAGRRAKRRPRGAHLRR